MSTPIATAPLPVTEPNVSPPSVNAPSINAPTLNAPTLNTPALWIAMLALAIGCVGLTLGLRAKPAMTLATVDLSAVIAAKEKEFTEVLSKPNLTDAQREQAYELVKAIGPQIDAALKALRLDCRCTLLTKGAVLSAEEADIPDLTALLKPKLGL